MVDTEVTSPTGHTRPAARGVLLWGPVAAFALLLLGLARNAVTGISDPDTLWHVLAGRHLWDTWQFTGPDPLSSFTVRPWVLNQWLPDLAFAGTEHLGGLPAVLWLTQLGRVAICVAIYASCRRIAGTLPAALAAGLAVLGTADSLNPRPQLVGFLLLAVTVDAWLRTVRDRRPRWWLLAVAYVWACSHGTWVVGVSLGLAVVAGLALDRRRDRSITVSLLLRLAAIPVAAAGLAALTPVGPALFSSFATVRAVSPYIQEWRYPALDDPSVLALAALAVVVPLVWLTRRPAWSWAQLAVWAVGLCWGLSSMRTVAVGAIVLAPLAAGALDLALARPRTPVRRPERLLLGGGVLATLALSAILAATGPSGPTRVPAAFDEELARLPAGSVVYNADVLGGWLMWSHPDLRHTADTRWELYGAQQARDYLATANTEPGWEAAFDRFHASAVIVEQDIPLVTALQHRGWTLADRSSGYALLVAR